MKATLTTAIILLFFSLVAPRVATADNAGTGFDGHWFDGYRLDVGLSVKQLTFDVYKSEETDTLGTLSGEFVTTVFLTFGSPYKYCGESNAGYYFQYGFSNFSMNTQEVDLEDVDLGTSAKGFFVYATPVFFYNFGDKHFVDGKGKAFKAGFGIGLGYLTAKGDIIFTNTTSETHTFDISSDVLSMAYYVLFDFRVNNWIFRAYGGGPEITTKDFDYNLFDFSFDIGYTFCF